MDTMQNETRKFTNKQSAETTKIVTLNIKKGKIATKSKESIKRHNRVCETQ